MHVYFGGYKINGLYGQGVELIMFNFDGGNERGKKRKNVKKLEYG
jgi:hypothetical protein